MNDQLIHDIPSSFSRIEDKARDIGFNMSSDKQVGSLLRTLVSSKPMGRFLELGTGTGLSLSWILAGMDEKSHVISIDNDPELIAFATEVFHEDYRVELICADGAEWIKQIEEEGIFDLIFADAWPGKYSDLEKTLSLLKSGGFYVIDDMLRQENWPEGHQEKAYSLIEHLENRTDIRLTKMNWSTGLIIASKI